MGRVFRVFAFAAAWLAGLAPAWAAEPSIKAMESEALADYQSLIGQLSSQILSEVGRLEGSGGSGSVVYFDLNQAPSRASGFDSLAPADQSLIQAAKRTYDLYRALGGSPVNQLGMVERRDDRYYIGLDGAGGRWLATPAEALSHLAQQLANPTLHLPSKVASSVSCPFHFECLLLASYRGDVPTVAYVPRATTVIFELTAEGLARDGRPPVVLTPPEFTVLEVTVRASDRVEALVSVGGIAALGVNLFHAFTEGRAFRPVASYGVHVTASAEELRSLAHGESGGGSGATPPPALAGSGNVTPLPDDHGNDSASATLLGAGVAARLEVSGDVDVFRIVVAQPGKLVVASSGATDVAAVLESADGIAVAADDDGGTWYNFRIEHSVAPGTYFLRVRHCCKGSGRYGVTATFTP